jgi:hypothetical protein
MIQKILQAASLIINAVIGAAAIFTSDPVVTKIALTWTIAEPAIYEILEVWSITAEKDDL